MQCVAQRESITFFVDVFKSKMNESLKLLADSVLGAEISTEEVDAAKGDMAFMREMVQPEFISKDVSVAVLGASMAALSCSALFYTILIVALCNRRL